MPSAPGRSATRAQIVADMESHGLSFRTFSIEHDSPHALADWDWNQRDLPHLAFVHGGFRFTPTILEDDQATGFYVQRIFGVRVPLLVSMVHPTPTSRVYETAFGPFALVIDAALSPLASGTHVRTTYSIGAPAWMRATLPIIERFLRANYAKIHDEDEPLRARRRQLRGWGYRFAADDTAASNRRSLDLRSLNVIAPTDRDAEEASIDVDDGALEWRIGRDDHLGLRVVRDGSELRVFPRMCGHEGASLDGCDARSRELTCPWHGRRIKPVCALAIGSSVQDARTAHHRLVLDGSRLRAERLR